MNQPKIKNTIITSVSPGPKRIRLIEVECDFLLDGDGKRFYDDLEKFLATWKSDESRIRELVNEVFLQHFPDAKIPKDGP